MAAKKTAPKATKAAPKKPKAAAKKKATPRKKARANPKSLINMPVADVEMRVHETRTEVAGFRTKLAGLVRLNPGARGTSLGRYRDGEEGAIASVLETVEVKPSTFQALADRDNGVDDDVVETQPSRDDLARRAALQPLVDDLRALAEDVSDTILALGARARGFSGDAYKIALANAPHDAEIASAIAPAQRFYASNARPRTRSNGSSAAASESSAPQAEAPAAEPAGDTSKKG